MRGTKFCGRRRLWDRVNQAVVIHQGKAREVLAYSLWEMTHVYVYLGEKHFLIDLTAVWKHIFFHFLEYIKKGFGCIMSFRKFFWAKYDTPGFVCIQAFTPIGEAFIADDTLSKGTV